MEAIEILKKKKETMLLRQMAIVLDVNESTVCRWLNTGKIGKAWSRLIIQAWGGQENG